jgi:hypothetical protein
MRGGQLAPLWPVIRAIKASPEGLIVPKVARAQKMGVPTFYRTLEV